MAFNFSSLTVYDLGYKEVDKTQRTKLSKDDLASIKEAIVTKKPDWAGKQITCSLVSGGKVYLKLSKDSQYGIGDTVDLANCTIVELVKGPDIIHRVIEDELLDE